MLASEIIAIKDRILAGGAITDTEAYALMEGAEAENHTTNSNSDTTTSGHPRPTSEPSFRETLYSAAEEITRHFGKPEFNPCSIINARSGNCSENCKWCAQSAHFRTGAKTYPVVSEEETLTLARENERHGIRRFSLVTSGKATMGRDLDAICSLLRSLKQNTGLYLCASLGLLNREQLVAIRDAGARRYHCNLETAPSFFPSLCTTHTTADKIATLKAARETGLSVCSGGIIGMGETSRQRVELALTLREVEPDSIPVNILCPIPGTPLADTPPIGDTEILDTVSVWRFIHPRTEIRFAGGRERLSRETQLKAMKIAVNGAIVGDLLTTIGSKVAQDRQLAREAGYTPHRPE